MKKDEKVTTVQDLRGVLEGSSALLVAHYRGLNVESITALRRRCRTTGATLKVIKNTLAKKAIAGTPFEPATEFLQGPTAIAMASGDPVGMVKVLAVFAKENQAFTIRGGVVAGTRYDSAQLVRLSTLPSREVLLSRMVGSMQSPISRMVGSIANPLRGLMTVLQGIQEKKAG